MLSFDGTYDFSRSRDEVWRALNAPEVLQATIPGCQTLDQVGPGQFTAEIALKFGLLRFRTSGDLHVEILEEARSYRLHGRSGKTMFGSGEGVAEVHLHDLPDGGTHLSYGVEAELEGRLANLGAGLVSGQLHTLGTRFFDRFDAAMNQEIPN